MQVSITRRDVASVQWVDSVGRPVPVIERRIGEGRSAARILSPGIPLIAGQYELATIDPDVVYRFAVSGQIDGIAPRFAGELALSAHFARDAGSECPTDAWIRMVLPVPEDEATAPEDFTYLVRLAAADSPEAVPEEVLVHAEEVSGQRVVVRVGETGCGCIPYVSLQAGYSYRIGVSAIDGAGNASTQWLSGEVATPAGR